MGHKTMGRFLLVLVTVLALGLQAAKLGSRSLLMDRPPTGGQLSQLAIVVWLLVSLWQGQRWARLANAIYYSLMTAVGVVLLLLAWEGLPPTPAVRWAAVL